VKRRRDDRDDGAGGPAAPNIYNIHDGNVLVTHDHAHSTASDSLIAKLMSLYPCIFMRNVNLDHLAYYLTLMQQFGQLWRTRAIDYLSSIFGYYLGVGVVFRRAVDTLLFIYLAQ